MDLKLQKNFGIKNVKKFYKDLHKMLDEDDTVVIDFSDQNRIHLAAATVLLSAYRECKKLKKTIKLKNVNDDVKNQLFLAGFNV
ncbi:MAG: STAS domain-containing protein [Spirochaetes bacterium]|nr:STAS domain-containing protein [Spirochaetota bacterium]